MPRTLTRKLTYVVFGYLALMTLFLIIAIPLLVGIRDAQRQLVEHTLPDVNRSYLFHTSLAQAITEVAFLSRTGAAEDRNEALAALAVARTILSTQEQAEAAHTRDLEHTEQYAVLHRHQGELLTRVEQDVDDTIRAVAAGDEAAVNRGLERLEQVEDDFERVSYDVDALVQAETAQASAIISGYIQGMFVIAGFSFVCIVTLVLLGFRLLRGHVVHPILLLATAANHVANGDLDQVVEVSSNDEIGRLQRAFNQMAHNLKEQTQLLLAERQALQAEIAERQRSEAALHESELRFRSLAQSANDAIVSADSDGTLLYWNTAARTIFGYTESEIVGKPLALLLPERYRDERSQGLARHSETGDTCIIGQTVEVHGLRHDGTEFPMELSLATWQVEGRSFYSAIMRDITERQRAATALRESEERFRALIQHSSDVITILDVDRTILYQSPACASVFGYDPDELIGRKALVNIHPDDLPNVIAIFQQAIRQPEVVLHVSYRIRHKDGAWRWLEATAINLLDRPAVGGIVINSRDITARKQAEAWQAQQARHTLLRAEIGAALSNGDALEQTLDRCSNALVDHLDAAFARIWTFNAGEQMLELRASAGLYTHLVGPHSRIPVGRFKIGQIAQEQQPHLTNDVLHDERIADKAWAEQEGLVAFAGHPLIVGERLVGVVAMFARQALTEDVLDALASVANVLAQGIDRLQTAEKVVRLAAIVESSHDAIVSKALDGTILSWNGGAQRLYGYPASDMLGRSFATLVPPERQAEVAMILQTIGQDERLENYETVRVRNDGTRIDVALTESPIHNAAGQVIGISTIGRDITERKQIDRMKNEFVSTVSHELRTPLTSIRGSLGLIAGGVAGELPARAKAMVEIAYNNSERLVRLINDILDIEKIESGKMAFNFAPLDLMALVQQTLEANRGYAEQFHVSFVLGHTLPGVRVHADSDRLTQVLTNLLSNAAKFSPPNATVTVSVTAQDRSIRIAVSDHGPGIPLEFRSRIFQKFAQADSSDTRQKGGTGLGLSIVKAIVEKHGGQIGFETELGKGTTFYVDLPVSCEMVVPPSVAPEVVDKPRVLVCEDDRDIATLLSMTLAQGGFASDIAYSALQAKQLLAQTSYVAMTLDLKLPDLDGIALIRELRAWDHIRSLPIVVVSVAACENRDELNGDAIGIVEWLDKPIDTTRLTDTVQRAVRGGANHVPRILHVEDDPDISQVIATVLHSVAEVFPARTLDEARQRLEQDRFDLVLLDIGLPDGSGLQLLPLIRHYQHPAVPVIIFSAQDHSVETADRIAATLVKSRTTNQQLLETITSLMSSPIACDNATIPAYEEA